MINKIPESEINLGAPIPPTQYYIRMNGDAPEYISSSEITATNLELAARWQNVADTSALTWYQRAVMIADWIKAGRPKAEEPAVDDTVKGWFG